ncbi:MAG: S1C family serine protease, partial [Defluviitaleaceae bacterium]|nr:S1C family serine protease [Defluviitaleaceae bacterium]
MDEHVPKFTANTANATDQASEPFRPIFVPLNFKHHEIVSNDDELDGHYTAECDTKGALGHEPTPPYRPTERSVASSASVHPAETRFYSETILSKKCDRDANFFKLSRFALVVAVFLIFGVILTGMGIAILVSRGSPDNYAGTPAQVAADAFTQEVPFSTVPPQDQAQQFRLGAAQGNRPAFSSDYIASALTVSNHIVELVAYIEPSVAAISTTGSAPDIFAGAPFRRPDVPGNIERALRGSGSGILFAEDDERVYIVTNAHVIEHANNVTVSVMGSSPVEARLVGTDIEEDLAVISIMKADFGSANLHSWSLARFGNSDGMQVGQMVLAIGNAMGAGNTVTNGVISGRQQEIIV